MKVIISNFPVPDSFVDNVAYTLKKMGFSVIVPKSVVGYSRLQALNVMRSSLERAFPGHWTASERWAVAAAKEAGGGDLLLWLTKGLRQEVLEHLRSLGVRRLVAWWGDAPANMRGMGLLTGGWDKIFIKDAATVAKFVAVGLPAELLHEACNPDWHRRLYTRISNEITIAGNYYGYRQYLAECLLKAGEPLALYGPPIPRWGNSDLKGAHRGKYIVRDEKSRVFGEALACLNSTALSEGDSLNCRAFEIAGACGLQLIEDKPAVAHCFEPGREVLTYRSVDEIREHLARARCEPDWANQVREAGYKRAHGEHTYEHRLRHILSSVGLPISEAQRHRAVKS